MLKDNKHMDNTISLNPGQLAARDKLTDREEIVTQDIIGYSKHRLATGTFFSRLNDTGIDLDHLKYIFAQYRHWRDQFHTWFGLCIMKSGSCEAADIQQEVKELAEHVVVEMKENHTKMYFDFLSKLGVDKDDLKNWGKGDATRQYERSFVNVFGTDTSNFTDSVMALSARELFASIRNGFVTKALKKCYGISQSPWWELHEHLEIEHFRGAIRPVIKRLDDPVEYDRAIDIMKSEIDRHVDYWDNLLEEAGQVISPVLQ